MKSSNSETFKDHLQKIQISHEQIQSQDYDVDEVFWLCTFKDSNEELDLLGPFWMYELKDLLQKQGPKYARESRSYFICPFEKNHKEEKNWTPLFEHPFFQRRKEENESSEQKYCEIDSQKISEQFDQIDHEQESFHLLFYGQKSGPYTYEQVKQMIEAKQIIATDLVSIDQGKSWGRLYEIEDFDRREFNKSELPHMPKEDTGIRNKLRQKLQQKWKNHKDTDTQAMANLAYIEKVRSGKISKQEPSIEAHEKKYESSVVKMFYAGVFVFSLTALTYMLWPTPSDNTSLSPTAKNQNGPEKLEPIETFEQEQRSPSSNEQSTIDNNKRGDNSEDTRPRRSSTDASVGEREDSLKDRSFSRESTPFRESKTYRRAQNQRREHDRRESERQMREPAQLEYYEQDRENYYYDDASGSLELDPVRETLSRDVIDPVDEDGYYHDARPHDRHDNSRYESSSSYPPADEDYDKHEYEDYYYDEYEEDYYEDDLPYEEPF